MELEMKVMDQFVNEEGSEQERKCWKKIRSAMCEANSKLGEGWRDVRKEFPEYDNHYLVYYDSGNMQVIFYWATTWDDLIKPLRNGDHIIAWRPLPDPPAFA